MASLVDVAQVVSAVFSGLATFLAYLAIKQAKETSDRAIRKTEELAEREQQAAEEARLPLLTVQPEDIGGQVALVVANDGGGLAKAVFVSIVTDTHRASAQVANVLHPRDARRVLTRVPTGGPFKPVPGMKVVVWGADAQERAWGWNQYGKRKLLTPQDKEPDDEGYGVDGESAVRAFWPDADLDGTEQVMAGASKPV